MAKLTKSILSKVIIILRIKIVINLRAAWMRCLCGFWRETSITKCKTNITFGYAKTFGGIVGSSSNCLASATINGNKAMVNGSTKPLDKRVVKLGGILAVKDGEITLEENIAAFRNLDTSWQYVFAVAPNVSSSNRYVKGDGYATGLHTEGNPEQAQEISLEDFNNS